MTTVLPGLMDKISLRKRDSSASDHNVNLVFILFFFLHIIDHRLLQHYMLCFKLQCNGKSLRFTIVCLMLKV